METKCTRTLIRPEYQPVEVTLDNETDQLLTDMDRLYWNTSDLCKYYMGISGYGSKTYDRINEDFETIKKLKNKLEELIIYKDTQEKLN